MGKSCLSHSGGKHQQMLLGRSPSQDGKNNMESGEGEPGKECVTHKRRNMRKDHPEREGLLQGFRRAGQMGSGNAWG